MAFSLKNLFMQTSTILGAAVGAPALGGALVGQLSWTQAALPLLSAFIAIVMPEKQKIIAGPEVQSALTSVSDLVGEAAHVAVNVRDAARALNVVNPAVKVAPPGNPFAGPFTVPGGTSNAPIPPTAAN